MPGTIMGIYGQQRSGKTLIAYKLVKSMCAIARQQGESLRVYTNLYCPNDKDWQYVNSIDELPLDLDPKVVLIDEIYTGPVTAAMHRTIASSKTFRSSLTQSASKTACLSLHPLMRQWSITASVTKWEYAFL